MRPAKHRRSGDGDVAETFPTEAELASAVDSYDSWRSGDGYGRGAGSGTCQPRSTL